MQRIRAARTLAFVPAPEGLTAWNFLTRRAFDCQSPLVDFLGGLQDWTEPCEAAAQAELPPAEADGLITDLVEMTALVAEGSELSRRETIYAEQWNWGLPAALLHFSLQDSNYMSIAQSDALQVAKSAVCQPPALFERNQGNVVDLPSWRSNRLLKLMAARRTVRTPVAGAAVTLTQLSDCLAAGMAIVGETLGATGPLPLAMTPSGGARNPFEAYVYARNVAGLAPGVYHYSALDHDLAPAGAATAHPQISALLGGQEWADDMACVIFLCAHLERTMWKYADGNAYRVVLIEAGHIGQNIMLAATSAGLSACPTAALSHSVIAELVGLEGMLSAPIYALTLSVPDWQAHGRQIQFA
jgi:SagB-type dehydrogenase family enzyme